MTIITRKVQTDRLKLATKLAGPRYERSVNLDLPIRGIFHAVIRSTIFQTKINELRYELVDKSKYLGSRNLWPQYQVEYDDLKSSLTALITHLAKITNNPTSQGVRKSAIYMKSKKLRDDVLVLEGKLDLFQKTKDLPSETVSSTKSEMNSLFEITRVCYQIDSYVDSNEFTAFTVKSFIFRGEAGIGKTHLLCDFAQEAYRLNHPVLIFLGEEFVVNDPFATIRTSVDRSKTIRALLEDMNDRAKQLNKRGVILIDAVNEAKTKVAWEKLLDIRKYKYLTFVLSVRTGYENVVLDPRFRSQMSEFIHPGLNTNNFNDVAQFFKFFKVPMPEVPLIAPEFKNPLFIKVFCKTYAKKKTVKGATGSTTLFEDYVKKQTKAVLKSAGLPYANRLWNNLVKPMAEWMGANGKEYIPRSRASAIINAIYPGHADVLLREMERSWLLTKTPHFTKSGNINGSEYRFPYQRFSDHLIARYLIKHHLNKSDPKSSFVSNQKLGKLIDSDSGYYSRHYGIVEALSIQIPEHLNGIDLIDVAPDKFKNSQYGAETFLNSLLWRSTEYKSGKLKNFNEKTVRDNVNLYANNVLQDGFNEVLETVISCSYIQDHPLDAHVLNKFLASEKMAIRDSFWVEFMHNRYGENESIIDRYIHWAMSTLSSKNSNAESIFLTSIVLTWFLTSPDRYLRDRSTKALINLLDGKFPLIIKLLKYFKDIDDIYIKERLYCVAYGAVLRHPKPSSYKTLAKFVYDTEFALNQPTLHILIRDYSYGIVNTYFEQTNDQYFDPTLYSPPYKSNFPKRFPSEKFIETRYSHNDSPEKSYSSITSSAISGIGDFGRYIIESNVQRFSNVNFDGSTPLSEKDYLEQIILKLPKSKRDTIKSLKSFPLSRFIFASPAKPLPDRLSQFDDFANNQRAEWQVLKKSLTGLGPRDLSLLQKYVVGNHLKDNSSFDARKASRWIVHRAVTLGWDPKLHGTYDFNLNRYSYGRHPNKPERIGKKYQWQALHEFLALLADNYEYARDEKEPYEGAWQLHVRDIDPSYVIPGTKTTKSMPTWWSRFDYENWQLNLSEKDWIADVSDVPEHKGLIEVTDPHGKSWYVLETHYGSEQKLKSVPLEKRYEFKRREIWSMLKSYLIKTADFKSYSNWVKAKNFEGRWMPESNSFYEAFYREFPNGPAFRRLYAPYYGRSDWSDASSDIPFSFAVTDDEYHNESGGYDMSIDDGFTIKMPSRYLFDKMQIRPSNKEGAYTNSRNEIVFLDPSIRAEGPSALLVSKHHLDQFLSSNNLTLIWTVLGEKQVIGGSFGRNKNWPGRLEFNGSYRLNNSNHKIEGDFHLINLSTR